MISLNKIIETKIKDYVHYFVKTHWGKKINTQ